VSTPDISVLSRETAQYTFSPANSSVRSSFTGMQVVSPAMSAAQLPLSPNSAGGRESYSYGGYGPPAAASAGQGSFDNRRRLPSFAEHQPGRTDHYDPLRRASAPAGLAAGGAGYSPRLSVQQSMQQSMQQGQPRMLTSGASQLQPQGQQPAHHLQDTQRNTGGSRSQYVPMPMPGYANNAYPRAYNRQFQPPPNQGQHGYAGASPQMGEARKQGYGSNIHPAPVLSAAAPSIGVRAAANLPLYARAGLPPASPPPLAQRELDMQASHAQVHRYPFSGGYAAGPVASGGPLASHVSGVGFGVSPRSQPREFDPFGEDQMGMSEIARGFDAAIHLGAYTPQARGLDNTPSASRLSATYPGGSSAHPSSSGGDRSSSRGEPEPEPEWF
jgi:hypothetical protein